MSYISVILHIQRILNKCGDPVIFITTGNQVLNSDNKMSIEIKKVSIKKRNNCFSINPPDPICVNEENSNIKYQINRIRISPSLAEDYSKGYPLTDEQMKKNIANNNSLFGCFD